MKWNEYCLLNIDKTLFEGKPFLAEKILFKLLPPRKLNEYFELPALNTEEVWLALSLGVCPSI